MTKQWELHEATIKTLYADHTLSVVRKIMIEKHGFKASTRAYRGRLIRWGVRKYNCKKRHDRASSLSSNDGCSSEPDPVSPAVSRDDFESMPTAAQRAETRRVSDSALAMLGRIGRQYDQVNGGPSQAYTDHYDGSRNRALPPAPPQPDVPYAWNVPVTHHAQPSPDGFPSDAETTAGILPQPYFNYAAQLTTSSMSAYPQHTAYEEAGHAAGSHRSLEYYRQPQRHNSAGQLELPYMPIRGYEPPRQAALSATGMRNDGMDGRAGVDHVKQEMLEG